jgi:membrane associated rhomboid family serine protease
MSETGIITLILIAANILASYKGFKDPAFYDRYIFEVDRVLTNKEYGRLITSGFLHVSWNHLIFNMLSLWFFGQGAALGLGPVTFLLVYFMSLVAGNLFALRVHRNHGEYSSAGASGAVCGIIFSSIALFPTMGIGLFFLPISIPAWIYGLFYTMYSLWGIRSKKDNIGHEAHLGGAVFGMIFTILLYPGILRENWLPILVILLPAIFFIWLIITKPSALLVDNHFFKARYNLNVEDRYNLNKYNEQKEIDRILDKISTSGMKALTRKEREALDSYSKRSR